MNKHVLQFSEIKKMNLHSVNLDNVCQKTPESVMANQPVNELFDNLSVILVDFIYTTVKKKVTQVMWASSFINTAVDIQQEISDVTQDIMLLLLLENGKILNKWQPEQGASLKTYVALIAQRRTLNHIKKILRKRRFIDDDIALDSLKALACAEPEILAMSEKVIHFYMDNFYPQLSAVGQKMFMLLFVEGMSVPDISFKANMSMNAVYAWKSRLRKKIRYFTQDARHP